MDTVFLFYLGMGSDDETEDGSSRNRRAATPVFDVFDKLLQGSESSSFVVLTSLSPYRQTC